MLSFYYFKINILYLCIKPLKIKAMLNSLIVVTVLFLIAMLYTIYRMVSTGKVKAKGAKKRRRNILPFFYKKKNDVMMVG